MGLLHKVTIYHEKYTQVLSIRQFLSTEMQIKQTLGNQVTLLICKNIELIS